MATTSTQPSHICAGLPGPHGPALAWAAATANAAIDAVMGNALPRYCRPSASWAPADSIRADTELTAQIALAAGAAPDLEEAISNCTVWLLREVPGGLVRNFTLVDPKFALDCAANRQRVEELDDQETSSTGAGHRSRASDRD